jgi:hypothetical protein
LEDITDHKWGSKREFLDWGLILGIVTKLDMLHETLVVWGLCSPFSDPYGKIQQHPQYSLTVRLEQVDTNKSGGTGEMTLNPVLALYLS